MRFHALMFLALAGHGLFQDANAFSMPTRRTGMTMVNPSSIMGKFPNPFGEKESPKQPPSPNVFVPPLSDPLDLDEFDPSPEGLIARAKVVMATDLGIQNANLLADNFIWIGPFLDRPLSRVDYLAAGRFFDLRSAFPDLDYRAHDYRIDKVDPFTVRVTARTVGTMRGELRLRDQTLPPNGQPMRCPPEAISITFDPSTGKIVKLCTGFTIDRLVGNTNGLCGVSAAAVVAGEPPSEWEIYPPLTVVQRFFGRPVAQLGEATSFLAPFPETVMIQLAKGVLSSNMAADDASLLSSDFTYMTPTRGPIGKKRFLEEFAKEEFAGVEPELSHFRVDAYDPNRVWVDVRPLAPGFIGPPQAMSFTFDEDGFCERVTSGAVMDPSLGNAGGLGGQEGLKYATGNASPSILTRPLPRVVGRLQKLVLSPITRIDVDDYSLPDRSVLLPRLAGKTQSPVETLSTLKAERAVQQSAPVLPPTAVKESSLPAQATPKTEAPKISISKVPTLSMPSAAKKTAKPSQEAVKTKNSTPTFSVPKFPTLTISTPPQTKKPTPKNMPAKVADPVFKMPTLSISAPSKPKSEAQPPSKAGQMEAQKAEEDKRRKQAELKKKQEEARQIAARQQEQDRKRKEQEAARKAAAEKRKQELEAMKAEAVAEARRKEQETKQAAQVEARRQLEEARKASAEKRQQELEAKKAEAAAAAEARKRELEAKQAAQEESKRQQEEARKAAAVQRQQELEAKKAEAAAAAEARKRDLEAQQLAQAEARRQQEEARKGAAEKQKREMEAARKNAASTATKASPGATINLFGLGGGTPAPAPTAKAESKTTASKPRPTINLFSAASSSSKTSQEKAKEAAQKAKPGATITLFGLGGGTDSDNSNKDKQQRATKAAETAKQAASGATINLFGLGSGGETKPSASQAKRATKAIEKVEAARPGATINLFGLGSPPTEAKAAVKKAPAPKPVPKLAPIVTAPRGVPTISGWRKNFDGSITGSISGSPNFRNGERVTTSPISQGEISPGKVVRTASGSRYFLK